MARQTYKGFNLPDGAAVPDVPADLRTLVDGIALAGAPILIGSFPETLVNGSQAGADTVFATRSGIAGLAVPYAMYVVVLGTLAGNGAINSGNIKIQNEAGVDIGTPTASGNYFHFEQRKVTDTNTLAYLGVGNYAAGATCGYKLLYVVSASNIFIGCTAIVVRVAR